LNLDDIPPEVDLRPVPWSSEAEQSVLGALMLDAGAFDRVGDLLKAADFFAQSHRAIYEAITSLALAHKPADIITVWQALLDARQGEHVDGGMAYLNALSASVPSAANIRRYAEIVREKSLQRTLATRADEAVTIALGSEGSIGDKVSRVVGLFSDLQRQQLRKIPRALSEIAIERTDYYQAVESGERTPGWPTHIPRLDRMLSGGLQPGRLYILAARPSVGKSSFAQSLGLSLANDGRRVLFLSQEMSNSEVADRGVANVGHVSYSELLEGKLSGDGWGRVSEAMDRLVRMPFYVDDQPSLTLSEIRGKAQQVKPEVLILDYLQLCNYEAARGASTNDALGNVSRGLKALSKDLGIAVLALSQLNRNIETRAVKRPTMADLRDSGAIEQDADVILFLWPVREFDDRRIVGLGVDKNRQGKPGEFGLDFWGDYQRWGESTADIRPQEKPRRGSDGFE
jgi:replicative DNA helicase